MKSEKAKIIPVNGHLLIEPLEHSSFIASDKTTYEEVGVVLERPWHKFWYPRKGDKVFFDSWLASKFPKEKEGEYFWLVAYKDVKAVEYGD